MSSESLAKVCLHTVCYRPKIIDNDKKYGHNMNNITLNKYVRSGILPSM